MDKLKKVLNPLKIFRVKTFTFLSIFVLLFSFIGINLSPANAAVLDPSLPTGITGGGIDSPGSGFAEWYPALDMTPAELGNAIGIAAVSGYYFLTHMVNVPTVKQNIPNGFGLSYNMTSALDYNPPLQDSYLSNGTILTADSPYISKWIGDPNSTYTFDISALTYNSSYYSNLNLYEYSGNNLIAIVNGSWSSDISFNNLSIERTLASNSPNRITGVALVRTTQNSGFRDFCPGEVVFSTLGVIPSRTLDSSCVFAPYPVVTNPPFMKDPCYLNPGCTSHTPQPVIPYTSPSLPGIVTTPGINPVLSPKLDPIPPTDTGYSPSSTLLGTQVETQPHNMACETYYLNDGTSIEAGCIPITDSQFFVGLPIPSGVNPCDIKRATGYDRIWDVNNNIYQNLITNQIDGSFFCNASVHTLPFIQQLPGLTSIPQTGSGTSTLTSTCLDSNGVMQTDTSLCNSNTQDSPSTSCGFSALDPTSWLYCLFVPQDLNKPKTTIFNSLNLSYLGVAYTFINGLVSPLSNWNNIPDTCDGPTVVIPIQYAIPGFSDISFHPFSSCNPVLSHWLSYYIDFVSVFIYLATFFKIISIIMKSFGLDFNLFNNSDKGPDL